MVERTFLIQRYCSANWSFIKGLRPFITSGPSFMEWVVPNSLETRGQYVLRPQLRRKLDDIFDDDGGYHCMSYQFRAVAEVLLREKVLAALWSTEFPNSLPIEHRWTGSIDQVFMELPFMTSGWNASALVKPDRGYWSVSDSVAELLGGMQSPAMVRDYLSEDGIPLEMLDVP